MKHICALVLLFSTATVCAEQPVPPGVKKYLDASYPGWVQPKINKEACQAAAPAVAVQGDFDGDGKVDYATMIVHNKQLILLAFLSNGHAYVLSKVAAVSAEAPNAGEDSMLRVERETPAKAAREHRSPRHVIAYISCASGTLYYTFANGKWKEVVESAD